MEKRIRLIGDAMEALVKIGLVVLKLERFTGGVAHTWVAAGAER